MSETTALSRESAAKQPTELYRHFDADGVLLYVGISKSTVVRLAQHAIASGWFDDIASVTIQRFPSREEAEIAEAAAIEMERPRHNVMGVAREDVCRRIIDSRAGLLKQIAQFEPVYSIREAADTLGVRPTDVERMVAAGTIGHVRLPAGRKRDGYRLAITGWQLIDYIEGLAA